MPSWRKILCATGLGEGCQLAVEEAAEIAHASGADLTLLHVTPAGARSVPPSPGLAGDEVEERARSLEHSRIAAERISGHAVRARLACGTAASEVVRAVRDEAFDLVVVGSNRRAHLGWLVMGSVAERIVREAPCPVLVARRRDAAH